MVGARCPLVVGRELELAVLHEAVDSAAGGRGSLLFVVGRGGVGKSRLSQEVVGAAESAGSTVLIGRAVPPPGDVAFRPLTEVLLQAFRAHGFPQDPELVPWLSALGSVVDAPGSHAVPVIPTNPPVLGEALLRVLRWARGPDPLVMVLEDLHWADPDSLAVLEYVADNLAGESVLAICTLRDEQASAASELARRLDQRGAAVSLRLKPLPPEAVAGMVRACAPGADEEVTSRVQSLAEGIPLWVEEMLATTGLPASIGEAVRSRVAELGKDDRSVVFAAAVLGRAVKWQLLPAVTGLSSEAVAAALERLIFAQLLVPDHDRELMFRHALTREAVLATMVPPRRAGLASAALAVLDAESPGHGRADLAVAAGDRARAGALLGAAGQAALRRGALATAVQVLGQAADLIDSTAVSAIQTLLVRALALAGRLDDAVSVGAPLLTEDRAGAAMHLELGRAAVAATRWPLATTHLDAADALLAEQPDPQLATDLAVLQAEVALAADDLDGARRRAYAAVAGGSAGSAEVQCQAWELIGRTHRVHDLDDARAAFWRADQLATEADLPMWRLRALHELGTVDMLEHGRAEALLGAHAEAQQLGALSTLAVLDIQLAGARLQQFDTAGALEHVRAARRVTEPLDLGRLHTYTHVFDACVHALRGDRAAVSDAAARARRSAPGDVEVDGLIVAGGAGMLELLWGDRGDALDALDKGLAALQTIAHSPPGPYRGLWPLLAAVHGRRDAGDAVEQVRRSGVAVNRVNRGYLAYAEAVLERSASGVEAGDADLAYFPPWQHIGRALVAEAALRDGWGEPSKWLRQARTCFEEQRLGAMASRCAWLLGEPRPPAPPGTTAREAEVLELLAQGLSNKEIATSLAVSHRTVEKHVENLLRKSGARSRTQLVATVRETT